jgi:lipopolysaccharide transport system permease protein
MLASTAEHPAPAPESSEALVTVVQPSRGWTSLRLRELWQHRELLFFLAWRDVKVRYKQTMLGAAWAIIQPIFAATIFTIFLGRFAKVPSGGLPYPLFAYAGLVPWLYFANAFSQSASSMAGSANLIRKVYFPRLALPLSTILAGLLDLALSLPILFGMMLYYGLPLTLSVLWIPAFVFLALIAAAGAGIWSAALDVQFRDVRYVVPFLIQLWMFATPVVYSSSMLHEPWRTLFGLNPMAGVAEGFRWALVGRPEISPTMVALSGATSLLVLVSGAFYFRRTEGSFADRL